jgi:hypothetical protein
LRSPRFGAGSRESGVSGFIVGDVEQAIEAVRHVGELNRLVVRRAFERRFTVEAMARAYLDIYRGLPGTRTGLLARFANGQAISLDAIGQVVPLGARVAA